MTYTRHLPVDRKNTVDDAWGTELAYYRSQYGFGARAGHDVPLSNTRASMGDQSGYRVATGKGVLFLHALRGLMGEVVFDRAMQEFGRQHGGQKVSTQQFQDFLQRRTAYPLTPVFDWWLHQTGLPYLAVQSAQTQRAGAGWETVVTLDVARMGPALAVPVTVETEDGASVTRMQIFDTANRQIRIATAQRPRRVVVDKYGTTPRANGSPFTPTAARISRFCASVQPSSQKSTACSQASQGRRCAGQVSGFLDLRTMLVSRVAICSALACSCARSS